MEHKIKKINVDVSTIEKHQEMVCRIQQSLVSPDMIASSELKPKNSRNPTYTLPDTWL